MTKASPQRKRARKSKSARKTVRISLAGRVTSFFKKKGGKSSRRNSGLGRVWAAFSKSAK